MPSDDHLTAARERLDDCEKVVTRLHKMCCEPDRSPRMQAILDDLADMRRRLDTLDSQADPAVGVSDVLIGLEAIGAQIGSLQVACCAPARMPLYADALVDLTEIQRHVSVPHAH